MSRYTKTSRDQMLKAAAALRALLERRHLSCDLIYLGQRGLAFRVWIDNEKASFDLLVEKLYLWRGDVEGVELTRLDFDPLVRRLTVGFTWEVDGG